MLLHLPPIERSEALALLSVLADDDHHFNTFFILNNARDISGLKRCLNFDPEKIERAVENLERNEFVGISIISGMIHVHITASGRQIWRKDERPEAAKLRAVQNEKL